MPITFAHPVFAVPFVKLKLPLSALVIGAMAPDVAHLIPDPPNVFRHNAAGVFCFALPVGLIALWLYHRVIKLSLASRAPQRVRDALSAQLSPFPFGPFPRFLWVCTALVVGAFTHLAADHFTHWYGWPVRNFGVLRSVVLHTEYGPLHVYRMLQYGGSLVGTAVLIYWSRAHLRILVQSTEKR